MNYDETEAEVPDRGYGGTDGAAGQTNPPRAEPKRGRGYAEKARRETALGVRRSSTSAGAGYCKRSFYEDCQLKAFDLDAGAASRSLAKAKEWYPEPAWGRLG